ncbi:cytochrome P450 6B2-like [Pararge aegeria]|uniref:unspecific monooxygenase n=2 Tax=Pararge aegeria TaxID=116150 RepID=A0A8S4S7N8_9NEOP|nr:cytochrome P450 6B2-like [Pararge aegeria]CAH2259709.1 jg24307 [Pararge aegeria aegeria]
MNALCLFSTIVFSLLCILYYLISKKRNYWKKRKVPHLKPSIFFGNYKDYITLRKYSPKITQEICQNFPDSPYVGVYYGTEPALVIQDPEMIKLVLAKDFYYFNSREVADHTHKELITQNMFFTGGDRWKVLRQNLTALFSSAKLKNMFYLIENCATQLEKVIDEDLKSSKTNVIEIKSLLSRYTMDCIGSCAFGVDTGTLAGKDMHRNPFTIMGDKLFDITISGALKMIGRAMWPAAFYAFGLKWFGDDIVKFFDRLLKGVFADRSYKQSSRNDFVDFVLGWKQKNNLIGDSVKNFKTGMKSTIALEVNDDLLVAQCILFFAAGFETTATTTAFTFYELAKHPSAQARVIEEVTDYFDRHNGKVEYECINEMPYLQACIDETLRLYPVLGNLTREVVETYTLPTGLRLEKGDRIHIPVYHIHHSPQNFPEPEEFRPERFYGAEKQAIKQFTYIPFGEGPRICMGLRFARMPIVAGLLTILKKYRVELADDMPRNIKFQPRSFVTQPMGGISLKFIAHQA